MNRLEPFLAETAARHRHLCPRQVLGVRIGLLAAEYLGISLPQRDKRVYAFVETDGCFVDGLAVATGCSLGRRTMRLVDYGKVAATLVDTQSHRAVRISPGLEARCNAGFYAPYAPDPWHEQLQAYQIMPAQELLAVEEVTLLLPLEAIISKPGLRVPCGCCGEEIMNERELYVSGRGLCRRCGGHDNYYSVTE